MIHTTSIIQTDLAVKFIYDMAVDILNTLLSHRDKNHRYSHLWDNTFDHGITSSYSMNEFFFSPICFFPLNFFGQLMGVFAPIFKTRG